MKRSGLRALAALSIFLILAGFVEIFLALYARRHDYLFRQAWDPGSVRPEQARRFFRAGLFDPLLGWDADPVARDHRPGYVYVAQSYGDSFTRGAEVADADTWQSRFFALTGRRIANLGVNGYGLDQAVLKFERYGTRYRGRVAILGLYPEEYRRALARYAYYCFGQIGITNYFKYAFKPIFIRRGGKWKVLPPPCDNAPCVRDLLADKDGELRRFLARHDLCYQENSRRPILGFPYTLRFIQALTVLREEHRTRSDRENYYFPRPESLPLTQHLIRRFAADAARLEMEPLVLLLYAPRDLRRMRAGERLDTALLDFLDAEGIATVDVGVFILRERAGDDDFEELASPLGHLNAAGNDLVARALARHPLLAAAPGAPSRPGGKDGGGP
jgi:hypothetical protein